MCEDIPESVRIHRLGSGLEVACEEVPWRAAGYYCLGNFPE